MRAKRSGTASTPTENGGHQSPGPAEVYQRGLTSVVVFPRTGLLSLAGAATSIIFVATKFFVVVATTCLSQQNRSFVATKVWLLRQNFCRNKIFFSQNIFYLSRQNMSFVAIKLRKYHFCRDKSFFATNVCLSRQMFVGTNVILSRQTRVCRDKNYTCGSSRQ